MSELEKLEKLEDIDFENMSDDDFAKIDPASLGSAPEGDQSADGTETDDNDADDTGGAESAIASSDDDTGGADSTSTEEITDPGAESQPTGQQDDASSPYQGDEQQQTAPEGTDDTSGEIDYEVEYNKVMSPFRAAKQEIKPTNVDDLRALAQKGVDYEKKMQIIKPQMRIVKTLERNGLLDIDKVNFLIDLDKKNPEAIQKFLKDNDIDPMDLSSEDNPDYKPNDHMIGDTELALDEVLDDIRETSSFNRTITVITKEWDKASTSVLMDDPSIIKTINEHVESGIFDIIANKMASEKTFGRLDGLSDLEAYKKVGDAIHAAGGFNQPNPTDSTSAADSTNQDFSQDSGQTAAQKAEQDLKDRRNAASPTRGSVSPGKSKIDLSTLSDAEVEALDPATL
jgi:hypothetical protein